MTLSVRMKVAAAIAAALGVVCFLGDVHAQGPFSPSIDRAEGAAISTYSGIDVSEDSFYAFTAMGTCPAEKLTLTRLPAT